ncbi:MAG: methyltransferase domain-containing protein [Microcystis wesenbergii Mw_MB_S_20031200_S109]|jgi:predicted SAM-dependent methyltransferase|uniref:Methyltransferase domain-containing protein n=1 Tax=Microcystis wesenbergii Mw_MB_S_20031200_S109D TaxID=2486241 RepID=A0A552LKC6_9CHRO|nr:MAG: methyltransferase domain-containing protein [Microcystis wesenbergii Mw_MB_S_20031200_S109]TRV20678.1 MAG: methyltransferase domain-containing protein [Microcystis wesenbergii Mw_MB_S_20031200_S109D]
MVAQHFSIYSTEYQVTLKGLLFFELKSLYGRLFLQKKINLKKSGTQLLHLGCGRSIFNGWTNADFFCRLKPWKKYENKPDWMLDLRFPLNCDDNVWDGVFTEHTLEHLYPVQVLNLLKELNRTMKPGAWLRVTVPDLKQYIDYYCGKEVNTTFLRWETGCEAIRSLTQNYGHLSVWDSDLLSQVLKEAGFVNIKEVSFRQGTDKRLLKDQEERAWETLYIEAQRP